MTRYPIDPERHPDRQRDVSPVLGGFSQYLEKVLADGLRQEFQALIPSLPGTANDGLDEWRGYMALDWLVRTWLPAWLELVPLRRKDAATLRELGRIVDLASAQQAGRVVLRVQTRQQPVHELLNQPVFVGWDAAQDTVRAVASHAAWHAVPDTARVISEYHSPGAARDEAVWAAREGDVWNAAQDAVWEAIPPAAREGDVWAAAQDAAQAAVLSAARDAALPAAQLRTLGTLGTPLGMPLGPLFSVAMFGPLSPPIRLSLDAVFSAFGTLSGAAVLRPPPETRTFTTPPWTPFRTDWLRRRSSYSGPRLICSGHDQKAAVKAQRFDSWPEPPRAPTSGSLRRCRVSSSCCLRRCLSAAGHAGGRHRCGLAP